MSKVEDATAGVQVAGTICFWICFLLLFWFFGCFYFTKSGCEDAAYEINKATGISGEKWAACKPKGFVYTVINIWEK